VVERGKLLLQSRGKAGVDLDHVQVRDPGREPARQDSQAPSDLEHDVARLELRDLQDGVEEALVDQEVLAQVTARTQVELAKAFGGPAAEAGRCGIGLKGLPTQRLVDHHPNTRSAFSSTSASSSSYSSPRSSATARAVATTLAGSFGRPRTG